MIVRSAKASEQNITYEADSARIYEIDCYSCKENFDALDTVWCSCLSSERTLVCPRCLNCFCRAPHQYKQIFWDSAPEEMWDRLRQEHDHGRFDEKGPEVWETKRPLVLIVEPDYQIERTAKRIIQELGYGAIVCDDGEKGLLMARQYMPDLILTAALMPKMDGRAMCLALKKNAETSHIAIVVMTALYTQHKYLSEAFKRFRVDEYLSKPVKMTDLQTVLQKHLDVRTEKSQL